MKHVYPLHAMKQFDVNLLWSQMRQTPRAPVEAAAGGAQRSRTAAAPGRAARAQGLPDPGQCTTATPRPGDTEAR